MALAGSEPLPVFARADERLHHIGLHKVAVKAVQLVEPEVKAGYIRIASEITEVFHQHEIAVELGIAELFRLSHRPQHLGPGHRRAVQTSDQRQTESVLGREIPANLAAAELRRVKVNVGTSLTQVRQLSRQSSAVALRCVPLAAEGSANAAAKRRVRRVV